VFFFDQMRHALERKPARVPTAKRTVPPGPTSRADLAIDPSRGPCRLIQARLSDSIGYANAVTRQWIIAETQKAKSA
jgi:hypothetical protein